MQKRLELDNLNWLTKTYDVSNQTNFLLGADYHDEGNGVDIVLYDTRDLPTKPQTVEEFHLMIDENGLDEENFEVDRVCLVKVD